MKTTDFSRLSASAPVNRTAGLVTSASRTQWAPKPSLAPGKKHWDNPPHTVPPHLYPKTPGFEDLRGQKMGWFTVVGYMGKMNPKKKARWLARCTCGDYETFSAATIKANSDPDVCCANCKYQRDLRMGRLKGAGA